MNHQNSFVFFIKERVNNKLVLVDFSHELLSEVPIFVVNIDPLFSEGFKFFVQIRDDNLALYDLFLVDVLRSQSSEFVLENLGVDLSFLAMGQYPVHLSIQTLFDPEQLLHILGVLFDFFGVLNCLSKLRWRVIKLYSEGVESEVLLLLGALHHSICGA